MDHTVPENLGDFLAMAQGRTDYVVNVICTRCSEHGELMTICATEEAVYITREPAKAFFGLVDPTP